MMIEAGRPSLQIDWIGPVAARFLAADGRCRVAATFERSLYIERDGDHVCLGGREIGYGPLNAVMSPAAGNGWIREVEVGQVVALQTGQISVGRWRAEHAGARIWQPPSWPPVASGRQLEEALAEVAALAAQMAPDDGLSPLVFRAMDLPRLATPFARIAAPRIASFHEWLIASFMQPDVDRVPAPTGLLGLGPGLTPSGDDAICGALLALDGVGALDTRTRLTSTVAHEVKLSTTPLSAAFLAAAAEGLGSAALHDFIAAVIADDRAALPATVATLARIGHTSGWDALTGAYLAFTAIAKAQSAAANPRKRSP